MGIYKKVRDYLKYLNKDFNSFKSQLIDFTQTYYPNTFNDFSEGSPGMMFLEMASYVGDVLSFYTDTQLQESFLLLAQEKENLYNLAYSLGYVPKVTTVASVDIDFFQQVPAKLDGGQYVPDYDYSLIIPENTQVTSNTDSSQKFLIEDAIDFSASSSLDPTIVSVYQISLVM